MRVYPRKGKGRTVWYIDYRDQNRRRVRKAIGTKTQAQLKLADIQTAMFRGRFDNLPHVERNIRIGVILERYFEYAGAAQTAMTLFQDRSRLKPLLRFFEENSIRSVLQIRPGLIHQFQADYMKNHSRKSWNNLLGLLKTILNRAVEWELIEYNPIARVKPLKVDRTFHFFTREEIRNIIDAAEEPYKTGIMILAHTGMRRSELWNLRWRDVDLKGNKIHIKPYAGYTPKNRKLRSVPISPGLRKHLLKIRERKGYLWRPFDNIHTIRKGFVRTLKELGYSGTLHDLRHTFASHLAMSGVPIPVISELLGHASIKTTMIYAHLLPESYGDAIKRLPY